MARKPKEKIHEEAVIPSLNEKGEIILTSDIGEELVTENVTRKIMELTELYGTLKIEVKDFNPRNVERAPVYKFYCEKCGEEIKSKFRDLHAVHKEDGGNFMLHEDTQ